MKTSLLFVLSLSAAAAHAQSQFSIYGVVDAGMVAERGGHDAPAVKISSGAASASRIGFRGTENLGDGLSAFFTLETGARIDTGVLDAGNTIFNHQAFVGLQGGFGAVAFGRQYTPVHILLVAFDPFKTGYAGTVKNLFPDIGTNIRTSNTVTGNRRTCAASTPYWPTAPANRAMPRRAASSAPPSATRRARWPCAWLTTARIRTLPPPTAYPGSATASDVIRCWARATNCAS